MSSNDKINDDPIGRTSMASAIARAAESKQSSGLIRDPFANIYAGQFSSETVKTLADIDQSRTQLMVTDVAVRTRFLDDLLEKLLVNVKQIVILACGGDFRPYRFSLAREAADVTFFLLDVPEVIAYRRKCLEKLDSNELTTKCRIIEIGYNLANEGWSDKLLEHGFNPNHPTLWLAEGFLHYLTEQDIQILFSRISQLSTKNSHIAFDLVSSQLQKMVPIIRFTIDNEDEVYRIFTSFGFKNIECTSFKKIGDFYNRSVSSDRTFIVNVMLSNQNIPSQN